MVDIPVNTVMQKFCIYIILVLTSNANAQESTTIPTTTLSPVTDEVILNDDRNHTWTSIDFPQPYPPRIQDLIITASSGYHVLITIESLDVDGDNGDFLIIKPGTTLDDEGKGKVFTYKLKSTRNYLVHSNTVYASFQVIGQNENGRKGFSLIYRRVGEEFVLSTENPTTEIIWPTPSGSESGYYTVYVSGKSQEDFHDAQTLSNFKTALAGMATEYCDINKVVLTDKITEENVQIYYLIQCPYVWPDSNTCVKVHFALPILILDDSIWTGYQLNSVHLEEMWIRLASKYLGIYGLAVYSEPDNSSTVKMWIVISIITLILFLILLGVVKLFSQQFSSSKIKKRRLSDVGGFMSNTSRTSKVSLAPHPYQSTPSFFENDYSYDQWEPNVGIPEKAYTSPVTNDYSFPLNEDDSDSEIIFDNFSNSRNNIEQVNKESIS